MNRCFPIVFSILACPAIAEGTRELDSHEHGVGKLNIAYLGNTVAMEFHAPGADIVGFEYEAKNANDRASIDAAVATLARPLELFVMPAAAECTVTQASAELESEDEHEEVHDHEDDHDEDHAEEQHDGDKHENEASHTEFHAEYTLTCGNLDELYGITFKYFEIFENALELEVQIVSETGAQAFEIERDDPKLELRGMF
ncbi:DUF2796 domain-containing protein [Pseudopelagicola sp. nBUS_19]|uniref:DUF2796 domain-containing protein n=1 Tax=Pseudopelagicola sp. nBUS_19 TaxID=3395316 RepID=UPI003EB88B42